MIIQIFSSATNDLVANRSDRLQNLLTACLSTVVSRPPTQPTYTAKNCYTQPIKPTRKKKKYLRFLN